MKGAWMDNVDILKDVTERKSSVAYPVSDYTNLILCITSNSNADFTIKVKGSFQNKMPEFDESASNENRWGYLSVRDLEDGTNIDGTVGIAIEGEIVNNYLVNTPGLKWIGVTVTSYDGGVVNVGLSGFN